MQVLKSRVKTLAVIGLGAIGRLVAEAAVDLGMNVIGYDPFLPAGTALKAGITVNNNLNEIFPVADYITLHVPLTDDTRKMICTESIDKNEKHSQGSQLCTW